MVFCNVVNGLHSLEPSAASYDNNLSSPLLVTDYNVKVRALIGVSGLILSHHDLALFLGNGAWKNVRNSVSARKVSRKQVYTSDASSYGRIFPVPC